MPIFSRSCVWALAWPLALPSAAGPASADTLFRLTEVITEQEAKPHPGTHVTRWQGDYYVADEGVSVTGWTRKHGGKPIAYDQSHDGTDVAGSRYTSVFHRLPNGVDVRIEYDTFILDRHVVQTGPQSCIDQVALWLKPGHAFYEVHRTTNHELMFDASRAYTVTKCEFPPLTS